MGLHHVFIEKPVTLQGLLVLPLQLLYLIQPLIGRHPHSSFLTLCRQVQMVDSEAVVFNIIIRQAQGQMTEVGTGSTGEGFRDHPDDFLVITLFHIDVAGNLKLEFISQHGVVQGVGQSKRCFVVLFCLLRFMQRGSYPTSITQRIHQQGGIGSLAEQFDGIQMKAKGFVLQAVFPIPGTELVFDLPFQAPHLGALLVATVKCKKGLAIALGGSHGVVRRKFETLFI